MEVCKEKENLIQDVASVFYELNVPMFLAFKQSLF